MQYLRCNSLTVTGAVQNYPEQRAVEFWDRNRGFLCFANKPVRLLNTSLLPPRLHNSDFNFSAPLWTQLCVPFKSLVKSGQLLQPALTREVEVKEGTGNLTRPTHQQTWRHSINNYSQIHARSCFQVSQVGEVCLWSNDPFHWKDFSPSHQ